METKVTPFPLKATQTFDDAARQRMRAILLRYKKDHKIGVPTLRQRISLTTGRTRNDPSGKDPYLIDQKTLQRFLDGTHRTNDGFLVPLAQFIETLPAASDPIDELSVTLEKFFNVAALASSAPDLRGTVQQHQILSPAFSPPLSDQAAPERPAMMHSCEMLVEAQDGRIGLRVRETPAPAESDTKGEAPSDNWRTRTGHRFEGVVVPFDRFLFALMRDRLTNFPKVHWIEQSPNGDLYSRRTEVIPNDPVLGDYQTLMGWVYFEPGNSTPEPNAA